jgi:hypothetical protein
MHEGDDPSFWNEFMKFDFFLAEGFIRILKQVPKYLATGLNRPSGTYSLPVEASIHGLKCKM